MRRNSRILLFFGVVWFGGVMLYVRHSDSADEVAAHNTHPKNRVRKNQPDNKTDKGKSYRSVKF